ncbi:MAG TPA: thiamine-phosphate kinase, partial [Candidatus Dormibacteraeota bacterium]
VAAKAEVSRGSLRSLGWGSGESVSVKGESKVLELLIALADAGAVAGDLGPGDDAAVWQPRPGALVVWSTDGVCEDVDFRRRHQTPYQVGWKAWMAAVSDLSAMGAQPRGGLVALSVPPDTTSLALQAVQLGLVEAAAIDGATVMGGDLGRSPGPLSVTVTVAGELIGGAPVQLGGGRAGDDLVVTGTLGLAAAALERLEAGADGFPGAWRDRLLQPPSRVKAGIALRQAGASAMTDISDGCLLDLGRICQASGVGADLWLDHLPLAEGLPLAQAQRAALSGGEDFELLAALPPGHLDRLLATWAGDGPGLTSVGTLTGGGQVRVLSGRGGAALEELPDPGFRHF